MKVKSIFSETNRGVLLDIVVFAVNLLLMSLLTRYFNGILQSAGENDELAQFVILACALAMFVLPATGAVLKRWHFHRRKGTAARNPKEETLTSSDDWLAKPVNTDSKVVSGCISLAFSATALFYFSLSIFLSAAVMSLLQTLIFGKKESPTFFVIGVIVMFALCVVQTWLVYRYFSPPKKPPREAFLRDPNAEQLGDLCIFLNMILFQIFWNIVIGEFPWLSVTSFWAFAGNLFFFTFIALMIYFPPRIFFLAEDFRRPITWITMLLANSPTILRVLFGRSQSLDW